MFRNTWILLAALLLAAPSALAQDEDPKSENTEEAGETNELNLVVGENKTLPAVGVKNYSEGIKGIADIKLTTDNTKFVIAGRKPGTTTLLLITLVVVLNLGAIMIRNRLRKKYALGAF